MTYRAIGIMSGSSLDGLDIAFVEFDESGGKWKFEVRAAECLNYSENWAHRLSNATGLPAYEYLLLHADYGKYVGEAVNHFIQKNKLEHQVQLIASHGHTTFHAPHLGVTAQLGEGAAIAAATGINVVSDLRALDVAFGGQGAPIVPIGEKLLLGDYAYFLNLGGIANVSFDKNEAYVAFDICAANRVLNLIVADIGKAFDEGGKVASSGQVNTALLKKMNELSYYQLPYPKSLANNFGTDEVYPLVKSFHLSPADALRTYVEHIVIQIGNAVQQRGPVQAGSRLLATGGGALNTFMVQRLKEQLASLEVELVLPDDMLINFKEAIIMALIGVLRWREEYTVINTVTGAQRSSIGGAVWIGQEA